MSEALMVAFNKSIATEFNDKLKRGNLPKRQPTPQQAAFMEAFVAQEGSMLGEAVAGSGKTYVLLRSALSLPNTDWTCKTMHGLGYSAWQSKLGKRLIVKQDKMFKILKDMDVNKDLFGDILKLARVAKTYGIVPGVAPRGKSLYPDHPDIWEDLAFQYDVEYNAEILHDARELVAKSVIEAQKGKVDFDDMLYMPVCYSGVFYKYPLVVVDEAQDLSAIQHEMLRKTLMRDGILVGAGDRHQAIYGFRGALAESIPSMVEDFSMNLYPLTTSFRCPKAVVAEAKHDVPHIEAFEGAIEGEVINHGADNPLTLDTVPPVVLCRNTAPLVQLSLKLIGHGRGAQIAGREVGKSLNKIIKKVCPKPTPIDTFEIKLEVHIEAQIARKPGQEATLVDKKNALLAIADRASSMSAGKATTETMIKIVDSLYEKNAPGAVLLSTIHKAKGLEWPDVLMLDPHLIPSKYAKQPWQLQQEFNIRYVGVTRAQNVLRYGFGGDIN